MIKAFGLSDIGLSRPNNEDVWVAMPEVGFFALADGMGGHQAGEVAARETINHLCNTMKKIKTEDCLELLIELRYAIEKANRWVYRLSQEEKSLNGMGTTLCCLIWAGNTVVYAHVGDSRIYRYRDKKLELLTQDHSLLVKWLKTGKESSNPFPYKNVITRTVGTAPRAYPELAIVPHLPGDLFFLCTDGLTDTLSHEDMEEILERAPDLEDASKRLVQRAKFQGSSDNITILMIQSEKVVDGVI